MRATCSIYPIILNSILLMMFDEEYKLRSSSFCNSHCSVLSLRSKYFPQHFVFEHPQSVICSFLGRETKFYALIKQLKFIYLFIYLSGFRDGEDSSRGLLGCDIVQCCGRYKRFGRSCCLHLQGGVR